MASTLLLVVVFIFDLIAFALAVAAEQRRASATFHNNEHSTYCVYESDIATGLGVGSLLFLIASQLLIMVASRCMCCGRALRPGSSRAWAIVLFITCWVAFLIAEVCLLAGSVRNAYHTKYRTIVSNPSCETLRKGVFGAGAAFIVFTGIVSELYYVSYSKANDGFQPNSKDTGIRMGTYN
uniref:Fiber protein Fb34 n=1 Tax=Davidia involucrata TaxID=16924 RepID=A0A5B7BCJ5_DAVIN